MNTAAWPAMPCGCDDADGTIGSIAAGTASVFRMRPLFRMRSTMECRIPGKCHPGTASSRRRTVPPQDRRVAKRIPHPPGVAIRSTARTRSVWMHNHRSRWMCNQTLSATKTSESTTAAHNGCASRHFRSPKRPNAQPPIAMDVLSDTIGHHRPLKRPEPPPKTRTGAASNTVGSGSGTTRRAVARRAVSRHVAPHTAPRHAAPPRVASCRTAARHFAPRDAGMRRAPPPTGTQSATTTSGTTPVACRGCDSGRQ